MPSPAAAARAIAPRARDLALEGEAARRLPIEVAEAMVNAGLPRLAVPKSVGGAEAAPAEIVEAIEALAIGDGAAGWCLMIAVTTGLLGGYLPPAEAQQVFGDERAVVGGVVAPRGTAVVSGDDVVVSGRWPWASFSNHCTWLVGGCSVTDGDTTRSPPGGTPEPHLALMPAADVEIVDTWRASGLKGTGSNDIEVNHLTVPTGLCIPFATMAPVADGPLYAFPLFGLLALGISAVCLGLARAAIDAFDEVAVDKVPAMSLRKLKARPHAQMQRAQAEAKVASARSWLYAVIDEAWVAAGAGDPMTPVRRARLRLAATHATLQSAEAVDLMYDAGGGSSVHETSPLQRCFRDVHTATQHMMVGSPTLEAAGRVLLGVDDGGLML
ncbi:MAG: indole-3-acetate monooxygenase [Actinomycetota bacterium]|jgi:alkylation response protein AidB-like acyl-CoA dehydrogenase|nr:indole-3-acetate monooxygenase [Actinomycetota bacterium]